MDSDLLVTFIFATKHQQMNKDTHFIGQPMNGQPISSLDKSKVIRFSLKTMTIGTYKDELFNPGYII